MRNAVRDARKYVMDELYGDGEICFFDERPGELSSPSYPIRKDERSIYTSFKWSKEIF